MGIFAFCQSIVEGLDYAISYLEWVIFQPFDISMNYIFGSYGDIYFKTLIFNNDAVAPHMYVPIVSDAVEKIIESLYGWIADIFPNLLFGGTLIVGTIINVFTITLIHWTVKAIGSVFKIT